MTVQQQSDTFIQGIKCATAQTIVVNVSDNAAICTSFDTYYSVLASKLELALTLSNTMSQSGNRYVSNFDPNRHTRDKNKRSNRTRDNERDVWDRKKSNHEHFTPELKVYRPNEWEKLSKGGGSKSPICSLESCK